MTREQLENYHDIIVRLKDLKTTIVTDSVKGSLDEYPYINHSVTLHGVRRDEKARQEVKLLEQEKDAIDGFIDGIEDVRVRNILDWKYRKGFGWNEIAAHSGRSISAEKEYSRRFFKRNLQK
ncbi:hypothetical protein EQM14_01585 [Caproiciproducens sp. NJN-50]|uniref:hypothetical protein n=1 Tax=Caproiciproducens sp. NJN-50 TaxID=2507162 RepID=UPI000FFE0CE9|nr:hypothetical protein [Caproiciproducens sp. NJN-50]QAT48576.1 hypothetical protein EQM14_01585 [Caproiciproducens sp. NJN-50]